MAAALSSLSDMDLGVLLKDDDHGAYAEIYRRYHTLLYSYALKS